MAIPATLSSVPSTTPYIQYVATSGQTVFDYPFPITQDSDLIVVANGVTLATDSGYTTANVGTSTGGSITFTSGRTAGDIITLYRDIPIERLTQIAQNSGFNSTAFNAEFNNIYLLLQQLSQGIDQCLQIPNTNNPAPTVSLTPGSYANKYLAFDANGNPEPAQLTTSGSLTGSIIAGLLSVFTSAPIDPNRVRTAAEIAAGVVPTNYAYAPYTLLRYGADPTGVNDSTTALQNAINCAQQANYSEVRVGVPGALLKIGSAWTIDTNKCGIDFQGAYVNATGFTTASGNWLAVQQSASDVNVRVMLNAAHPIRNATIQGSGAQNTQTAVYLNDTNATPTIAGVIFRDIGFVDWAQDVVFDNGAFCNLFDGCTFAVSSAGSTTHGALYSVTMNAAASNAGERNIFKGCGWYNKNYHLQNLSGSADMFLHGCSLDSGVRSLQSTGGGSIFLSQCHIESGDDTDNWLYVSGQNSSIYVVDSEIVLDANKTAKDIAYSDVTCTNGGIFLSHVFLGPGAYNVTVRLIGGTGNARADNLVQNNGSAHPAVAAAINQLAYGDFESANYANDWAFSGATAPSQTSAQAHSGAYSLQFPGSGGNQAAAVADRPCQPGQYIQGELWYLAPAITGTGADFYIEVDYLDQQKAALATVPILTVTADVAAWTFQQLKTQTPAPPGTAYARLSIKIYNGSSGTPIGYVDDVVFNVV